MLRLSNISRTRLAVTVSGLLLTASFCSAQGVSNCQASPYPVSVSQPDGSGLDIIGLGGIDKNHTETLDGLTIQLLQGKGYVYVSDNGMMVTAHNPSKRSVAESAFTATLKPHQVLPSGYQQLPAGGSLGNQRPVTRSFPVSGKRKILVILIQYPDAARKYLKSDFQDLLTKTNFNGTGSFRDYYQKNTFGKLDVSVDVAGWYTATNNYSYYGNSNGYQRTQELVAQAVDEAHKEGIDFSQYDNDGDGIVDGVFVVHAGLGAEQGSQNQYIWSHRSSLWSAPRKYNGVNISDYIVIPETRLLGSSTRQVGIGVICHEFGHLLGLPDFYDTGNHSEGAGNWSLMAGGAWNGNEDVPACHDAYSKAVCGWVKPTLLSTEGIYTLRPAASDSVIYKIVPSATSSEYYLLENRQQRGYDAKLDGSGLAIWHVDADLMKNTLSSNTVNTDPYHQSLYLVQADGKRNLDTTYSGHYNRGDKGDLFPGSSKVTTFTDSTKPSARFYNGTYSGIHLYKIAETADSSVVFTIKGSPSKALLAFDPSICAATPFQPSNNSRSALTYLWTFGDGGSSDTGLPTHYYSKYGRYLVKLKAYNFLGIPTQDSAFVEVPEPAGAAFTFSSKGKDFTFNNTTAHGTNALWYWGDGNFEASTSTQLVHHYDTFGMYQVIMLALNSKGCTDTFLSLVHVKESPATAILTINNDVSQLTIAPNPASNNISLEVSSQRACKASFNIVDMEGRIILSGIVDLKQGNTTLSLPVDKLPSSAYSVQVETGETLLTQRCVVQH